MKRKAECSCGQVSAVVTGDPVKVITCHCDDCQKRTGSVFQVSCWYPHERVLELNGQTKSYVSSTGARREFCPNCGTTVHWTFDGWEQNFAGISRFRGFAVGCFVDKNFPKPDIDVQTQYQHHWVQEILDVESFAAFPPPEKLLMGL